MPRTRNAEFISVSLIHLSAQVGDSLENLEVKFPLDDGWRSDFPEDSKFRAASADTSPGRSIVPHEQKYTYFEFTARTMALEADVAFYTCSDGLLDQVGGQRRIMFGKRRFKRLLREIHALPMPEQRQLILQSLADYQGEEIRRDDVSVIGFRV